MTARVKCTGDGSFRWAAALEQKNAARSQLVECPLRRRRLPVDADPRPARWTVPPRSGSFTLEQYIENDHDGVGAGRLTFTEDRRPMRRLSGWAWQPPSPAASLTLGMAAPAPGSQPVRSPGESRLLRLGTTHRQPRGDGQSRLRSPDEECLVGSQGQAASLGQGPAEDLVHGSAPATHPRARPKERSFPPRSSDAGSDHHGVHLRLLRSARSTPPAESDSTRRAEPSTRSTMRRLASAWHSAPWLSSQDSSRGHCIGRHSTDVPRFAFKIRSVTPRRLHRQHHRSDPGQVHSIGPRCGTASWSAVAAGPHRQRPRQASRATA